jgi:ferredoxin-type protein NapF
MDRPTDVGRRPPRLSITLVVGPAGDVQRILKYPKHQGRAGNRMGCDCFCSHLSPERCLARRVVRAALSSGSAPGFALSVGPHGLEGSDSIKPAGKRRLASESRIGRGDGTVFGGVRGSTPPPLRPPGTVDEARFAGLCVRCGSCLRACPTHIIQPDQGGHGIASLLTPTLDFSRDYCHKDCTQCTEVCPSGALAPVTTEEKQRASIGLPRVDMNICLLGDDRECSLCRNWCPYEAITLEFSPVEYTLTPRVDPAKCPGCGACQAVCPTSPIKAIVVHPL